MSLQARQTLVDSKLTIFQRDTQRSDFLNEAATQTTLIALLLGLIEKGWALEFTAVKTDHHDDSSLGLHCHYNGYCADLWPLNTPTPGDYMDSGNPKFQSFLKDCAASPWRYQIGLVGDGADSAANFAAAGPSAFQDDGGSHVHLGAD